MAISSERMLEIGGHAVDASRPLLFVTAMRVMRVECGCHDLQDTFFFSISTSSKYLLTYFSLLLLLFSSCARVAYYAPPP